jgi:hypothetical protein
MTPSTLYDEAGVPYFAEGAPSEEGETFVSIWRPVDGCPIGDDVDLSGDFEQVVSGRADVGIPVPGHHTIALDEVVQLPPGHYLVVVGFDLRDPQRVHELGVGGYVETPDLSDDIYPGGQVYACCGDGDVRHDSPVFAVVENPELDLQLFFCSDPAVPTGCER